MSYTALYRKFRPLTFESVVGQEHIVRTLKNQLKTGRVSHAYLFCGTRGTGKTSTAKIFARAINCLSPQEEEPCNSCSLCTAALEGRSMNVMEIDAASNNGVDNIREIREDVKYPPTEGRYKVYIIDEVHMLSSGAFNALLKTLEEPPAHVVFILATTDPQKVPPTILSRCQRYDFKRIHSGEIAGTLQGYLLEEGFAVEEKAVDYIARLADGSMRDSLSLLDQCVAFYSGQEITLDMVLDMVGAVDNALFFAMTEGLLNKDVKKVLDLVEEMILQGRDTAQFISDYIVHFRNLLVVVTLPNGGDLLDMSSENVEQLKEQGKKMTADELVYFIKVFSKLQGDMKYALNQRILLEVILIQLCSSAKEKSMDAIAARLAQLERVIKQGVVTSAQAVPQTIKQGEGVEQKPKKKPPALSEDRKAAKEKWSMLRGEFDPVPRGILAEVQLGFKGEEDEYLYLICAYEALMDMVEKYLGEIKEKLGEAIGKEFQLRMITKENYDSWYLDEYGAVEESQEDADFQSIMSSYFPEDVDFQE